MQSISHDYNILVSKILLYILRIEKVYKRYNYQKLSALKKVLENTLVYQEQILHH